MENRYIANETLDKLIIGTYEAAQWHHKYIGENEVPCCSWSEKTIYSPVLPPLVDPIADAVIRGKNAHEAGHARLTRSDKNPAWSQLKCNVANALEDLRIEAGISKLSAAIAEDIKTMNKSVVGEIQRGWSVAGCQAKPLDEALFALSIMEGGFTPVWAVSPEAQKYIDAAKNAFGKWKEANQDAPEGFAKIIEVADEVVKCFEQAKQEMGNGQGEGGEGEQNQNQQGNGQSQQSKKPSAGNQQKGEGEKAERNSSEEGNNSGTNGNEKGEEQSQGEVGDENKQEEGEGRNEEGEGNNNANDAENANDNGENAGNEGKDAEGKENNGNENGEGEGDNEGNGEQDGKETDGKADNKSESSVKKIEAGSAADDFDGKDFKTEAIKKIMGKAIGEAKKELSNAGIGRYTSYTQEDEIREAESRQSRYEQSKQKASGMVAKLRSHLEQMLRSMSRCRVVRNREGGDLDVSRLADLAKSLTRNVFTETLNGISLDTTVSILIDESGSIGDTCEVFQTMAIAFSEALERLGIKYEILGHTTKCANNGSVADTFVRARPMLVLEHKRFDEPLRKAKYKLGSIGSFGCNADGEALLHTWKRAEAQRAKRHIVFVLSDGEPNAASRSVGNSALYKHLKSVVDHIRKAGGEVYAIGIGTQSPKQFYGDKYFFYANDEKSINDQFFRNIANVIAKIQK